MDITNKYAILACTFRSKKLKYEDSDGDQKPTIHLTTHSPLQGIHHLSYYNEARNIL